MKQTSNNVDMYKTFTQLIFVWVHWPVYCQIFSSPVGSLQGCLDLFRTAQNSFCTICFAITMVLGAAHFNKQCNADYSCSIRQSNYFVN